MIERSDAQIAIVGPSTIGYISTCDRDRRNVATMLHDMSGAKVLDLSLGGQSLSDSLNLAAASGSGRDITDVVLPLAYPYLGDWTTPPYRKLLVYKAVTPRFKVFAASSLTDLWGGLSGSLQRSGQGYRFEGVDYPDYDTIAAGQFAREKRLMTCPEPLTSDLAFTRSYFWWTHVSIPENTALYDLIADLQQELAQKGRRLHVVLLPINLSLIRRLDAEWPAIVEQKAAALVAALARGGVPAIDLSAAFAPEEFSTQWCACIHLNDT